MNFSGYFISMVTLLIKLKLIKQTILSAFGAGVVATHIAKKILEKKKTEDLDG